jgi:hypothetical protein
MTNLETINKAIFEKKVIKFYYDGELRGVEPFLTGVHKDTGNDSLRAWWTFGYTKSNNRPNWRLYTVNLISNIKVMDEIFDGDRIYYNPTDKDMSTIYECV